jgi:fused signal recognition particle receptor
MDTSGLGGPIGLGIFVLILVLLGALFIRKARKNRREMFAEKEPGALPRPGGKAAGDRAAHPGHDDDEEEDDEDEDGGSDDGLATADTDLDDEDEAAEAEPTEPVVLDPALQRGLDRTREGLFGRITALFRRETTIDQSALDKLEEALLTADVGVKLSMSLVGELRDQVKSGALTHGHALRARLKERLCAVMGEACTVTGDPLGRGDQAPRVILFVGVNGVGKTTTIGKVAQRLKSAGHQVLLAAGDTFRAAAVEQLSVWGQRTGCEVVRGEAEADPGAVIFKAIQQGAAAKADFVLADTAGRLHTKTVLMDEIRKVKRAAGKAKAGAPDEIWLVVDATTGQNALRQAEEFHEALGLTGVILTKLDGTAKGGVVIAIATALKVPVLFVGVGESAEDLRPFDAQGFIDALFAG